MPDLFHVVIGTVLIIVSLLNARMLYTRLGRRRSTRIRKVMSAPAGFPVRTALLLTAVGVWNLTAGWPVAGWPAIGVEVAIIAWETAVQATALARRVRSHGRAPRAP
jgi:hypothetical protein